MSDRKHDRRARLGALLRRMVPRLGKDLDALSEEEQTIVRELVQAKCVTTDDIEWSLTGRGSAILAGTGRAA